jgi:hypothetical protein
MLMLFLNHALDPVSSSTMAARLDLLLEALLLLRWLPGSPMLLLLLLRLSYDVDLCSNGCSTLAVLPVVIWDSFRSRRVLTTL